MPYKYRDDNQRFVLANRAKKRNVVNQLKAEPCTDCRSRFHPEAMGFDHITTDKFKNVSHMLTYSLERILSEVKKCELVCANCHAVRTYNRRTRVADR